MRIQQLPPAVANQIAAGEVIERPASVVKELLENALDAGADALTIEIGYGGLNHIKISDNGSGIMAEDLPLAVAAHATSKITKLDDLYAINSMGFRGEALASIASVAKLTISSKPAQQEHAMMLGIKGNEHQLLPCARSTGTTIEVVDLFFNAPVRKRFLKNEKLEFQAIEAVVKRFALSAPAIAITLKHNGKVMLALPSAISDQAKLARMNKLFGNNFVKESVFLDASSGTMRIEGWISGPGFQRSQNDRQWIYINQRMVKDKLLNHALKQAYEGLLHPGRFPAYLLYFTIDTAEVDVNVHPTKHEVRFQQPRLVHDFFTSQLAAALQTFGQSTQPYSVGTISLKTSEVCEPRISQRQLSASEDSFKVSPYKVAHKAEWIVLNNRYALIFHGSKPWIMDVISQYEKFLLNQIHQLPLPLASRPLLVPICYPLVAIDKALLIALEQLGLRVEIEAGKNLILRSVPVQVPHLAIRAFLDKVVHLTSYTTQELLIILSQSQAIESSHLSTEEQADLVAWVTQSNQAGDLGLKELTVENCQVLMDV